MSFSTFARNAIDDYRSTAAIAPSSRNLARAMVDPLRGASPKVIVEFGPGTGVMTRELLKVLHPLGTLLAFEISPRFVRYLHERIADPRLEVVQSGAERATEELASRGIKKVDGVVSSLGVGLMAAASADAIFRPLLPFLGKSGTITQFQYMHRMRVHGGRIEPFNAGAFLATYFRSVKSTFVLLNLPPAYVITCRDARNGEQQALRSG